MPLLGRHDLGETRVSRSVRSGRRTPEDMVADSGRDDTLGGKRTGTSYTSTAVMSTRRLFTRATMGDTVMRLGLLFGTRCEDDSSTAAWRNLKRR